MCGYVKPRVAHGVDVGEESNGDTMMAHLIPNQALIERAALPQVCQEVGLQRIAERIGTSRRDFASN
jgi:hypothetical protein